MVPKSAGLFEELLGRLVFFFNLSRLNIFWKLICNLFRSLLLWCVVRAAVNFQGPSHSIIRANKSSWQINNAIYNPCSPINYFISDKDRVVIILSHIPIIAQRGEVPSSFIIDCEYHSTLVAFGKILSKNSKSYHLSVLIIFSQFSLNNRWFYL